MIYKKNTLRRTAAAAAAICLAFAFAFAEETGADRLGFGTSITVSADDLEYNIGTAKITYTTDASGNVTITKVEAGDETSIQIPKTIDGGEVKAIGSNAFDGCTSLESVFYPSLISGTDEIPSGTAQVSYTKTALDVTVDYVYTANKTSFEIPETIDRQAVTAIGRDAFRSNYYLESVTLPQSVKSIGKSAFENCYDLTSINIPQKVTAISDRTFSGCPSLKSVNIPSNVTSIGEYAFENCITLANVTIPSSVTSIGEGAFFNCYALTSLDIPSSVTSIGDLAFHRCTSLTSIDIPANVTSIGSNTFERCTSLAGITMPSVTSIEESAFKGCSALKDIDMPNIVSIGNYAFKGCTSLAGIAMPSVTSIGNSAFNGCSALKDIDMPNIVSIGNNTFKDCTSLTSIDIPSSVTSIGDNAFLGCTSLETVIFPQSAKLGTQPFPSGTAQILYTKDASTGNVTVTKVEAGSETSIEIPETIDEGTVKIIGANAFKDCDTFTSITLPQSLTSIEDLAFCRCTALQNINIPQNVTNIGVSAFLQCESLTSITIPSGVTSINDVAFSACTSLKSIELPDHLVSIGVSAFNSCTSLENIVIPAEVTSVGSRAFSYCTSLESIAIPMSVISVGNGAFDGCTSLKAVFAKEGLPLESASIPSGAVKIYYQVEDLGYVSILKARANAQTSIESIEIPRTIGGLDVRTIKEEAFRDCGNIKNIILPDSIREIQNSAFSYCTSLESINIPVGITSIGDYAFEDCTALKSVVIPQSVTNIGYAAFSRCDKLVSIDIPMGVSMISNRTFENCISLTAINIPTSVRQIGDESFMGCTALESIDIPEGVTSVGQRAFMHCTALESAALPDSLTEIKAGAFQDCTALKSINIPKGVTSIEAFAFSYCQALADVTLPESIQGIDMCAFDSCPSLETIVLPPSTTYVRVSAFANCTSLKTIFLPQNAAQETASIPDSTAKIYYTKNPDGNVTISDVKEGNETSFVIPETICGASVTAVGDGAFDVNENITSVILPDSVTSIGSKAFYDCISLKSIKLPKNITSIEKTTFANCTSLTNIEIPENVTSIKAGAFGNCSGLTKIALPDKLTELGNTAFRNCPSLTEINIPSGLTAIGERAFIDCSFTTIELPENLQSVGSDAFLDCDDLKRLFYPAGADISAASVPDTSAKIKYEIRDNFAYILEITPDSSNTPVVIPDTIRGYEVKYVEEEYRQYVSETGHTHKGGTATCTETAYCAICGTSYNSINPSNHDADTNTWKYDENGHWNPCLRTGCEEHLNAAAHTFDNGVVTTEPTENSEGVKTYTCETCGYQKTKSIPKLGHTPSAEWSYDSENHWKKCTNEGCNEKFELTAHTFDNGVITAEPTDTTDGVRTYTCTVCGYEKTESIEKLPSKPAEVIYPIAISGDVTADRSSAAAGETVTVSAPFGYDIIVTDINGRQIAKFSEKGSFTMPASGVSITAVRGEIFTHMSNAWSHSYVYSYDSDMNRIKVNSDTRRGVVTIDLGADYAGRSFTVYSGRKSTSKKIISGTLDENGRYIFNADEGKNYTLVIE